MIHNNLRDFADVDVVVVVVVDGKALAR